MLSARHLSKRLSCGGLEFTWVGLSTRGPDTFSISIFDTHQQAPWDYFVNHKTLQI